MFLLLTSFISLVTPLIEITLDGLDILTGSQQQPTPNNYEIAEIKGY